MAATGILENLLADLIAQVVCKTIKLAYHIARDSQVFVEERHDFQVRMRVQIKRLEDVESLLCNRAMSQDIQPRDRHTYFNVMQKLHRLLFEYVVATEPPTPAAKQFVQEVSAEELFRQIESSDPTLANPSPAQEKFWLRAKEKVVWVVYKKEKLEKLVVGVEAWGDCLATLISTTVPLIWIRKQFSAEEIWRNTPGTALGDTNVKGQILIERKVEAEEAARPPPPYSTAMSGVKRTRSETIPVIPPSRLKFMTQQNPVARNGRDADERSDLGGASRRQWAQLLDDFGNIQELRVIVEFKERPPMREFLFDPQSVDTVKRELRSLVKELRLAERFQVLYCHGFYETPEHYGLVYRLPRTITTDEYMQCESLGNVLLHEEYKLLLAENLQNRLDLAKSLATTMYHLHSVQWVHKSFNPDNILLFGRRSWDKKVEFDWAHPYVVGFDASRANRAHSDKLPASLRWENRVYTHPARQREGEWTRFHKLFDIYSLGVVLLEMGTLTCFKHPSFRRNAEWTDIPASEVQKRFGDQAMGLKAKLGRTYSEIVEVCLSGNFGVPIDEDDADETMLLDAFRSDVCEKFDQVRY
jgi:serine/threonine protein kinase